MAVIAVAVTAGSIASFQAFHKNAPPLKDTSLAAAVQSVDDLAMTGANLAQHYFDTGSYVDGPESADLAEDMRQMESEASLVKSYVTAGSFSPTATPLVNFILGYGETMRMQVRNRANDHDVRNTDVRITNVYLQFNDLTH